jgi:hypothetical protein
MVRYPLDPNLSLYVDWSWWVNTRHTVRKYRLAEQLMKYRVRSQSLSSPVPDKRRKLALSKLSRLPAARPLILGATYGLYRWHRRGHYLAPKPIRPGSHSNTT